MPENTQVDHRDHRMRMRKRFALSGLNAFEDHEALELLLFYAIPVKNTNDTAHRLVQHFGSLHAVFNASLEEIKSVHGVGEQSAMLIKLVDALCIRRRKPPLTRAAHILDSAEKAGGYFISRFYSHQEESLLAVCLNAKNEVIHERIVCVGSSWYVNVLPSQVAEIAVRNKAASVIIAHNHPSGSVLPSPEDQSFTLRLRDALKALDIRLLDHIIVADDEYTNLGAVCLGRGG